MNKLFGLLLAIIFFGCGDGSYHFKTLATYQATASNLEVELIAIGHVLPGDDLGDGQVKAKIYSSKFSDTIYLETSATVLTSLMYKNDSIAIRKPYDILNSLTHCLNTIGFSEYDTQELKEFGNAIETTAYGPKGTYLEGQTDFIEVISVNFSID